MAHKKLETRPCNSNAKALANCRRNVRSAKERAYKPMSRAQKDDEVLEDDVVTYHCPPVLPPGWSEIAFRQKHLTYDELSPKDMEYFEYYYPGRKEQKLERLEQALKDVPRPYLLRALASIGNSLKFASYPVQPVEFEKGGFEDWLCQESLNVDIRLPKTLISDPDDLPANMPTHYVAVYGERAAPSRFKSELQPSGRRIQLFPVHAIVLFTYCKRLPKFPRRKPRVVGEWSDDPSLVLVRFPVVPISVDVDCDPYPLLQYLSSLDRDLLLHLCLDIGEHLTHPCDGPTATVYPQQRKEPSHAERVVYYAKRMVDVHEWDLRRMLWSMYTIEGLHRNAVCLAVDEAGFWETIALAREVCLVAIKMHEALYHQWQPVGKGPLSAALAEVCVCNICERHRTMLLWR